MHQSRLLAFPVAFAIALAPVAAVAEAAAASEPTTEAAAAPVYPAIYVTTVEPRDLADRVIATGLVAPVEQIQVQPLIEGQPIEALMAEIGDMVKAGQVLAILSKSTLDLQRAQSVASLAAARATVAQAEAQLLEAESSAAEAERVADRTRKLRDQGTASQAATDTANANAVTATAGVSVARQSLEAARAQIALIEAQLANVELQLTRTEVQAPYAGRVVERNATIGAVATAAGLPMFVIEKDGALELRADVSESDIARLSPGQPVILRASGMTETLSGTVRLIEPVIDSTTRLGRARIALDASGALRAGMFMEASILIAERKALAVPISAISGETGQQTVMRVNDGVVELVNVTIGIREAGWVEIVSGLEPGDLVVTKAGSFVRPGNRINPIPADGTN
jgi:HlyD family secretion protein